MERSWFSITPGMVIDERLQAEAEGRDLTAVQDLFASILAQEPFDEERAEILFEKVQSLPYTGAQEAEEPSDLEEIKAFWVSGHARPPESRSVLAERIHGAWLGRVCGCFLGKVCEGWRRPTMEGYLKGSGQWPLSGYISNQAPPELLEAHGLKADQGCWIELCDHMPEDDDLNYTVTGMEVIRQFGRSFTPTQVAQFWLQNIPILRTFTAERVAYRNFVNAVFPPLSATWGNPYREWIGAQIRADFFGYANPGDPYTAAEYGWRDASISHIKNGIYGEMWSAAMNAAALTASSLDEVIESGFAVIPPKSRLALALRKVVAWHAAGKTYEEAVELIHAEWDEKTGYGWCHTISNAMVVLVALLWGGLDYGKTIGYAVQACFDTDCNGATAGSVLGGLLGVQGIPDKWSSPFHDTLETGVQGYTRVKISDMAKLTMQMIE